MGTRWRELAKANRHFRALNYQLLPILRRFETIIDTPASHKHLGGSCLLAILLWPFFLDMTRVLSLSLYFTQVYRLSHSFFHPRSRQLYQPRFVQVIGHGLHRQERRCRPRSAESIVCEEGNLSIPFPKVIHRVNPKEEEEWFPSTDVTIASLDSLLQVTRQPKIRKAVNTRERKQDVL